MNNHLNWIRNTFAGRHAFSPQSLILVVRTVKTDRWAIAVNVSSKVFRKLLFNVASAAGATVWGDWSAWSIISSRGPKLGKSLAPLETSLESGVLAFPETLSLVLPLTGFRVTMAINKPDRQAVEEPGDTQSLPAATSGVGSANIEEGNDEE